MIYENKNDSLLKIKYYYIMFILLIVLKIYFYAIIFMKN